MSGIYKAMVLIGTELKAIGKNQINQGQKFKFRGIDDVYNELKPLMAKHGVSCWPEVFHVDNEVIVTKKQDYRTKELVDKNVYRAKVMVRYKMVHVDGSSDTITSCGEGMDFGDKATSKAMSIAHKYALLQAFCIPTEDSIDPDAETIAIVPAKSDKFEDKSADIKPIKLRDVNGKPLGSMIPNASNSLLD